MTRVVTANIQNLKNKIMTDAKQATFFLVKDSKIKAAAGYRFAKTITEEARLSAVKKMEKALNFAVLMSFHLETFDNLVKSYVSLLSLNDKNLLRNLLHHKI